MFAICWVGVVLGLFTMASTKLPSYITPCYPAAAILVGRFVDRLALGRARIARFWPAVSCSVLGMVGLTVALSIAVVGGRYVDGATRLVADWIRVGRWCRAVRLVLVDRKQPADVANDVCDVVQLCRHVVRLGCGCRRRPSAHRTTDWTDQDPQRPSDDCIVWDAAIKLGVLRGATD